MKNWKGAALLQPRACAPALQAQPLLLLPVHSLPLLPQQTPAYAATAILPAPASSSLRYSGRMMRCHQCDRAIASVASVLEHLADMTVIAQRYPSAWSS